MVLKWPHYPAFLINRKKDNIVEGGDLLCNKQLVTFLVSIDPNVLGPYQFIVQNVQSDRGRVKELEREEEF